MGFPAPCEKPLVFGFRVPGGVWSQDWNLKKLTEGHHQEWSPLFGSGMSFVFWGAKTHKRYLGGGLRAPTNLPCVLCTKMGGVDLTLNWYFDQFHYLVGLKALYKSSRLPNQVSCQVVETDVDSLGADESGRDERQHMGEFHVDVILDRLWWCNIAHASLMCVWSSFWFGQKHFKVILTWNEKCCPLRVVWSVEIRKATALLWFAQRKIILFLT